VWPGQEIGNLAAATPITVAGITFNSPSPFEIWAQIGNQFALALLYPTKFDAVWTTRDRQLEIHSSNKDSAGVASEAFGRHILEYASPLELPWLAVEPTPANQFLWPQAHLSRGGPNSRLTICRKNVAAARS
jgi:hypothetical protein